MALPLGRRRAKRISDQTAQRHPTVHVLLDESGNGNADHPLIVGAVATDKDFADLENAVNSLYRQYGADTRRFEGLESFDRFKRTGFHASQDPPEIRNAFLEFISNRLDFKAFMVVSNRERLPDAPETDLLLALYSKLLTDVLLRFRKHDQINIYIEQNDTLQAWTTKLRDVAVYHAKSRAPYSRLPPVNITMVPKMSPICLSIIDYLMFVVSKWIRRGAPREPSLAEYRNFRLVEPCISMLYSIEDGLLSNRASRVSAW